MALHLYFVRHGETAWSRTRRHTGRSDIPLTTNGESEARDLGPNLRNLSFEHVFTSPLKRAQLTCELVGLSRVPVIENDLAEWNYGDYEGKKSASIRQHRPGWDVFRDGCPNGESPAQVLTRADRLIARLRELDGNVAVFSHGQFGGVVAARWIDLSLEYARHFSLDTASVSILSFETEHPEVPVIVLWNYTSNRFATKQQLAAGLPLQERSIQRWENEGGEIPMNSVCV